MFSLFRRYKRLHLTKTQLNKLCDYTSNLSLFFLGSILAPLFTGEWKMTLLAGFAGGTLTFFFLGVTIYLARKAS